MKRSLVAAAAFLALGLGSPAIAEESLAIVAAENFYGEAAAAIAGDRATVESVIVAPGADPHDFELPASVARLVADADIVILNGAGYDHWMEHLLESTERPDRVVIDVAALLGVADGGNPHIWYDPKAMPALAEALAATLSSVDPEGRAGYEERRNSYLATLAPIDEKVAALREAFAGTDVAATEPVFGPMADALGLKMTNEAFQRAIMNETEPSARDIAALEEDIRSGRIRVLFTNAQVEDAFTRNLEALAHEAGVPLVSVTETLPPGQTFTGWMLDTLSATEKALRGPSA